MSTPTPEERARALYRRLFQLPGNADTRQADIAAVIRAAERAAALAMRERCARLLLDRIAYYEGRKREEVYADMAGECLALAAIVHALEVP